MSNIRLNVDGQDVGVVIDNGQRRNILDRHFRMGRGINNSKHKAGNFAAWASLQALMADPFFRDEVIPTLVRENPPLDKETARDFGISPNQAVLEIDCGRIIGWTAAVDFMDDPAYEYRYTTFDAQGVETVHEAEETDLHPESFDRRQLRKGVMVDFVDDMPAPMTRTMTVIASIYQKSWGLLVVIYSVRPGIAMPEFPRLRRGDYLATWENDHTLVFWDWDSEGDDPADPVYPYGRHVDEPRRHLLTNAVLPEVEGDEE